NGQMQAYVGPSTRVVDLHGRTVVPGLIDSHIHAIRQGLTWDAELHWQTVPSLAEGLRMIRERAARTPPGTWIVVAGGWHESQFTERRKPTPQEIDAISAHHPIWVQELYDEAMMNRAAMTAVGLTAETKDPFGGKVLKDASGQPTGAVTGFGGINASYFKIPRPAPEDQVSGTRDWFRELNRLGMTGVGDAFGPLPPQVSPKAIDGWRAAVRMIIESGWRFQAHATRNHSAEQRLPAIEEINREIPVQNRRLAFAHMEDVTPDTIRRIKALGGGITIQDRMVFSGDEIAQNWPPDIVQKAPPMKAMLAMGLPVGGGTDATRVAPYNPFVSLWWIVTGRTVAGHPIRAPQENLSRLQALRVYTLGSAWFNMDEDQVGSIEPGKDADLAVLSADYLTVPAA